MNGKVCPSVTHFSLRSHHCIIMKGVITNDQSEVLAKGQGQSPRSQRSKPNLTVSGPLLQFEFTYDDKMMHKAWSSIEEVSYCFSRSSIKFQGNMGQKSRFWPKLGVSGLQLQLEFTDGYEIMHKAWSNIEGGALLFFKVPRQILRSHGTKKSPILTRIERFWTAT